MTRQEIFQRLQAWRHQAEQIMSLFNDRQRVPAEQQEKAKAMFAALKDQLEAEHARLSPMKIEEQFAPDEQAFYAPAVHEGFNAISHVRRNSTPDAKWFTALDDILICMDYHKPPP